MGPAGGAAAEGLEDLQGGKDESPREENSADLEANALRSLQHGAKVKSTWEIFLEFRSISRVARARTHLRNRLRRGRIHGRTAREIF